MITCLICNKQFSQIGASHLKKHGLTTQTYRQQFTNAPLVKPVEWTDERREAARQRRLGWKHPQEVKDKIGNAHKGKIIQPESIARQRELLLTTIEANGGGFNKGKKMSDEFRTQCSETARARTPEQIQAKVELMWAARRGQKESDEVRKRRSESRIEFMAKNPDKINKKFFNTVPELQFAEILTRENIVFSRQYHTSKPHFLYDFKIGDDILIEIDGPYHYERRLHPTDEAFEKRKKIDQDKSLAAKNLGMKLGRIKVIYSIPENWREILAEQGIVL